MSKRTHNTPRRWIGVLCAAALFGGCELVGGQGGDASDAASVDTAGGSSGDSGTGTSGGDTSGTVLDGPHTREVVCARWKEDRQFAAEGIWTGAVNTCDPGDIQAPGRENAIRQLNLVRWLAGQPPVSDDPALNTLAQACALVTHANNFLTHTPDPTSACYSDDAAEGAGASNIAGFPAVGAILDYMVDPGNDTTFGHRRWLLSNDLGDVGIGSTDAFSCLYVFGPGGAGTQTWIAWPTPGAFPIEATTDGFFKLDDTGWTIQSDAIDLSNATATISKDGQTLPTQTNYLQQNFGATHAISIVQQGWLLEVGATYHVEVSGTSQPIAYEVELVRCE